MTHNLPKKVCFFGLFLPLFFLYFCGEDPPPIIPYSLQPPHWKDWNREYAEVECGLGGGRLAHETLTPLKIGVYTSSVDPTLAGWYRADLLTIGLSDRSHTARSSAFRHEVFLHRLPHYLTGDPNSDHDPRWEYLMSALLFRTCEDP